MDYFCIEDFSRFLQSIESVVENIKIVQLFKLEDFQQLLETSISPVEFFTKFWTIFTQKYPKKLLFLQKIAISHKSTCTQYLYPFTAIFAGLFLQNSPICFKNSPKFERRLAITFERNELITFASSQLPTNTIPHQNFTLLQH